jgi:hypothetical protein
LNDYLRSNFGKLRFQVSGFSVQRFKSLMVYGFGVHPADFARKADSRN